MSAVLDEMIASLAASSPEVCPEPVELSAELVHDLLLGDDDVACSDPECWRCHSPLRPENLRTLAKNLKVAGMLCRAWELRGEEPNWRPGCHIELKKSGALS